MREKQESVTFDSSIALLDLALRRRFTFVELMPEPSELAPVEGVALNALLSRLNDRITILLDRDHQIGHSYFVGVEDVTRLRFIWYHRVIPLLQEYFYNDSERLSAVLGDKLVMRSAQNLAQLFDTGLDFVDPDRYNVTINHFEGDDQGFLTALAQLSGKPHQPTTPPVS